MRGPACPCLDALAPADLFERTFLGTDELYGDASIDLCRTCGHRWLHYHLTYEGFAGSGRWFRGQVAPETALSPRNAALVFGDLPGYFAGGCFFSGQAHHRSGPAGWTRGHWMSATARPADALNSQYRFDPAERKDSP